MRWIILSILAFLTTGCGRQTDESAAGNEADLPVYSLVRVDSIGVELGDSNYVMGAVEGVAYAPDGNLVVLDCFRSCMRVYSPEGEFIRQISQKGNGPGELQDVAFLGISEDGYIYLAGEGSETLGIHVFDYYSGEWLGSESSNSSPPTCIEGADGTSHVRMDTEMSFATGEPIVQTRVARWDFEGEEPEVVYYEDSFPYNPTEFSKIISIIWDGFDIAAGFDGRVYIAPLNTEAAMVYACERDGTELFTLDMGYEPALRTEDEMEMERMVMTMQAAVMGDTGIPIEPDPYKPLIGGLELDGAGNLWIHRGDLSLPTFDVISGEDGSRLFSAVVAGNPPDGSTWRFYIDETGILAYAADPACGYQKIYMLELVE
jgi:hypothetical protein